MKHDMDQLLNSALSSREEPDDRLNQRIMRKFQEKENENMSKKNQKIRIPAAALLAVIVLAAGSASAYAAWKYLTPGQVAESAQDQGLAAAFQSEDALTVNEVQEYGGYRITLLGIVSGKNLSEYLPEDDAGNVSGDRTYVVTAIENADGTKRPDTSSDDYGKDPFFVSPLIEGLNPAQHNIVTMGGSYFEMVEDGVQYRLAECDNVEKFADRRVYLGVNDGTFYNNEAFQYNESSGGISRNDSYQGVNALFVLPLDKSKADREAAEEYLKNLQSEEKTPETQEDAQEGALVRTASEESSKWNLADFNEKAALVKEMQISPDEEGNYNYEYTIEEDGTYSSGKVYQDLLTDRDEEGLLKSRSVFGAEDSAYVETYTLNEDRTLTLRTYKYK
ncbi:MAG: hypothetical protein HFI69_03390 [Lachnospiraceae bacterium]|nr:hypothetical protein [Lachnospiraceae bacterium]